MPALLSRAAYLLDTHAMSDLSLSAVTCSPRFENTAASSLTSTTPDRDQNDTYSSEMIPRRHKVDRRVRQEHSPSEFLSKTENVLRNSATCRSSCRRMAR